MKNKIYAVTGIALGLASMWIGAWFIDGLPKNHWAEFPAVITAGFGFLTGFYMFFLGWFQYVFIRNAGRAAIVKHYRPNEQKGS